MSFKSLDEFTQDDQKFKNYFQKVVPSNKTFNVEDQRKIFHIDSTNVTRIEKDSTVTYTMLLRNTKLKEGAFKNLVIEFNLRKNTKKAFVIKYIPDKNGLVYNKQHDNYGFKGSVSVKEINLNKSKFITFQRDCRLVYVTVCNWGGTEHIAGPNCTQAYMYDVLVADCPDGSPTQPDLGHGGGSNGGINTVPVLPDVKEAQDFVIAQLELTGLERNWIRDAQQGAFVRELQDFLQGNLTSEAIAFAEKAVEIKLHGGEVDFVYQVIIDPSFKNNTDLYNIYVDMGKAPTFDNYLQDFDSDMSVADLKLNTKNNFSVVHEDYTNAMALTNPPLISNLINIDFNTDPSTSGYINNQPEVFKVVSLIHEMIHADMYRKMLDAVKAAEINQTDLNWRNWPNNTDFKDFIESLENKYFGIFDYYTRYEWDTSTPDNSQHQAIAQHYRDVIKQVLNEYDPSLTSSEKEALSWIGLMDANIVAWQNLTPSQKSAIISTLQNF